MRKNNIYVYSSVALEFFFIDDIVEWDTPNSFTSVTFDSPTSKRCIIEAFSSIEKHLRFTELILGTHTCHVRWKNTNVIYEYAEEWWNRGRGAARYWKTYCTSFLEDDLFVKNGNVVITGQFYVKLVKIRRNKRSVVVSGVVINGWTLIVALMETKLTSVGTSLKAVGCYKRSRTNRTRLYLIFPQF